MFTSQLVVNGNCTQAQIVRAFGISAISMKRYVKQYRQSGAAGFFKARAPRQPRVLTPAVRQKAQELIQQGQGRNAVAQELGINIRHVAQSHQGGANRPPPSKKK